MFILLGMKFDDLLESLEVLNDNAVALIYFSCLGIVWFFVLFLFLNGCLFEILGLCDFVDLIESF